MINNISYGSHPERIVQHGYPWWNHKPITNVHWKFISLGLKFPEVKKIIHKWNHIESSPQDGSKENTLFYTLHLSLPASWAPKIYFYLFCDSPVHKTHTRLSEFQESIYEAPRLTQYNWEQLYTLCTEGWQAVSSEG